MYVWNRGGHRDVVLAAQHSLGGGTHATKLIDAVRLRAEIVSRFGGRPFRDDEWIQLVL